MGIFNCYVGALFRPKFKLFSLSLLILSGCKSSSSGGGDDDPLQGALEISGTLGVPSMVLRRGINLRDINPADVDLDSFIVTCVTISANPKSGSASVDPDGSFTVTVPGAEGAKITCNVRSSTLAPTADDDDSIATFVVSDNSELDINGNPKTSTSFAIKDDADLGDVELDLESGKAQFDKSSIDDVIVGDVASGDVYWDATGTWTFSDLSSLPTGYKPLCEPRDDREAREGDDCFGPASGESIYIKQVAGKKYVEGAPTDEDRYGIMVWRALSNYLACGSRLGTTYANLQSLGVDFSDSDVEEGEFTFSETLPWGDPETTDDDLDITDGYKVSGATAFWEQRNCHPFNYQTSGPNPKSANAWICHDDDHDVYQVNLNGGCETEDGEPFQTNDWNYVSWGGCTSEDSTDFPGFKLSTCSATYDPPAAKRSPISLTCKNLFSYASSGQPTESDIDFDLGSNFHWDHVDLIVEKGGLCSSIDGDAFPLEQARCFVEFYYRNTDNPQDNADGCFKRLETDWTADTVEEFIQQSDRPSSQYVAAFYDLDSTGIGSLHDEQEFNRGVKSSNNGADTWINCRVRESFTLNMAPSKKDGENVTEVIGTFETEQYLIDKDKPACVAHMQEEGATKKDLGNGVVLWALRSKHMFKMTKDLD